MGNDGNVAPWAGEAYGKDMDALRDQLVKQGIPREQIVRDWAMGRYRADMAILDPLTKAPVAVFELKTDLSEKALQSAHRQLVSFAETAGNPNLRQYLAARKGSVVQLYRFPHGQSVTDAKALIPINVPEFGKLVKTARALMASDTQARRAKHVDRFKYVCWAMALLVVIVIILDAVGWYTVTSDRLALIGAAAALVVIPYAGKLKMLGVEFERKAEAAELPVNPVPSIPDTPIPGQATGLVEGALERAKKATGLAERPARSLAKRAPGRTP